MRGEETRGVRMKHSAKTGKALTRIPISDPEGVEQAPGKFTRPEPSFGQKRAYHPGWVSAG